MTLPETIQADFHWTASSDRLWVLCCQVSCRSFISPLPYHETLSCNPTYPSCFDSKPITQTETLRLVGFLTLVTARDSVGIKVAIAAVTFHARYIYKPPCFSFFDKHIIFLVPRTGWWKCRLLVVFSRHSNWPKSLMSTLQTDPNLYKDEKWSMVHFDGQVHFSHSAPPNWWKIYGISLSLAFYNFELRTGHLTDQTWSYCT